MNNSISPSFVHQTVYFTNLISQIPHTTEGLKSPRLLPVSVSHHNAKSLSKYNWQSSPPRYKRYSGDAGEATRETYSHPQPSSPPPLKTWPYYPQPPSHPPAPPSCKFHSHAKPSSHYLLSSLLSRHRW